ncbi:MAG: DMT family transporter, partial [Eggerthellaceae bacterium]|nr:DMT family transporter [Eggerthellaceae bacterium]
MVFASRHIPTFAYELMLVFASIIWALGTIVIKDAVYVIPPYWLVGLRFSSAGILLSIALLPRMIKRVDLDHIKAGLILGVFVGITYLLNTTGLAYTTAANSSFLTSTY